MENYARPFLDSVPYSPPPFRPGGSDLTTTPPTPSVLEDLTLQFPSLPTWGIWSYDGPSNPFRPERSYHTVPFPSTLGDMILQWPLRPLPSWKIWPYSPPPFRPGGSVLQWPLRPLSVLEDLTLQSPSLPPWRIWSYNNPCDPFLPGRSDLTVPLPSDLGEMILQWPLHPLPSWKIWPYSSPPFRPGRPDITVSFIPCCPGGSDLTLPPPPRQEYPILQCPTLPFLRSPLRPLPPWGLGSYSAPTTPEGMRWSHWGQTELILRECCCDDGTVLLMF
jgi:hypothetical protein